MSLLTAEERVRLAALDRDDWGLRPQEPVEAYARDLVLIRCHNLFRDGVRLGPPPLRRIR